PQTPQDCMDTPEARAKEMAWMQSIGIKGIKVDFFAGDKQSTMKLYEDILKDANKFGICVNFHGATLPRGWERMYPNYMTSEAVYGMENCIFTQEASNKQPMHCAMLPFTRNTVAPMDFTPTVLNNRLSKDQQNGSRRRTSAAFELALPIVFFSPIQHFGLTPDNLIEPKDSTASTNDINVTTTSPDIKLEKGVLPTDPDRPYFVTEYLKKVPTTWDETKFIEGFPGKYCVIARRSGEKWYIGAINGDVVDRKIDLDLSFMGNGNVIILMDANREKETLMSMEMIQKKKGKITLTLKPESGAVLYTK
ncbi:MAG: glycoside hydrolase family 97 catalytic domain-containing protein, partial [Bacteroidales bacterium]|nr:glycoside hydrolase family 97 catalytic domain-containing protein [Bacteroidales bacterium]